MAGDGGWHTRIVRWLKVALPLAALALLSTLFLVSNRIGEDATLPYSQVEIEDRLREPRMTRPSYSGVTSDGASLTINADEARPAGPGSETSSAQRVTGLLKDKSGSSATLKSDTVVIDSAAHLATLTGAVEVTTSEGFRARGEGFATALDISKVESTAPVVVAGPPGTITADHMLLVQDPAGQGHVLRFKGNVKLVYLPNARPAGTQDTGTEK